MRPLVFALSLGAFCAVAGASMAAPERPGDSLETGLALDRSGAAGSRENPAVAALLDSVDQELAAERPQQALALLERALRIEPRNPALWHYLGLAHFALGDHAQAEAMAAKSRNLAAGNRTLRSRNDRLMASALRAQGKPVLPASREVPSVASRMPVDTRLEPAATYAGARSIYERQDRAEQRRAVTPRPAPQAERRSNRRYRPNGYAL